MDEKLDHVSPDLRNNLRGYQEIPLISVTEDVVLGEHVVLSQFVNLYGCTIGDHTSIGAFTEIGRGVNIGRRCKIGARVFIPPGVTIGNEVFIGPGVLFSNDKHPQAMGEWELEETVVCSGASIGLGCVILPGLTLGKGCMIGAGTLVTKDVPAHTSVYTPQCYATRTF